MVDHTRATRIERHLTMAAALRALGDAELRRWLVDAAPVERGCASVTLPGHGGRVFVKFLPLTALESKPENRHSTANVFHLPAVYHYRLGSLGFGAWRELEVHREVSRWVRSDQGLQFPLLHDWRVLPLVPQDHGEKASLQPWGADPAIQRRVSATQEATRSVVLFLEDIPLTLGQWLRDNGAVGLEPTATAWDTEAALLALAASMNRDGLLHMDLHFENILVDGRSLFVGDFGLAVSRGFELDSDETAFFDQHQNFDRCTVITSYVHALVTPYDPSPDWRRTLKAVCDGSHPASARVPEAVRSYLWQRECVASEMGAFYRALSEDLATPYPADRLQRLIDRVP